MEMKHSRYRLDLKKTSIKLSKNFPQTKHASQMSSLQILKTFQIAIAKNFFNNCLQENKLPNLRKKAEIPPVLKKLDNTSNNNYRPISTLSDFTKIFFSFRTTIWKTSSQKCRRFPINHDTSHSFLRMIESWKVQLNNGTKVGTIIMDLSKAFNSLN